VVALEVGFDQAPAVCALLRNAGSLPVRWSRDAPVWWSRDVGSLPVRSSQANRPGFRSIEVLLDLAGHDRVVVARR
jgi:methylase of polypeptide subunit release factors